MRIASVVFLLSALTIAYAHKHPKTEHEKEVQRALQIAAYHCAPAVEAFTRIRKQAFGERIWYNHPGISGPRFLDQQSLFNGRYADLLDSEESTRSHDERKHLDCMPVSETYIQNNTCVLAPEGLEGPYYRIEKHPLRQNIAEYQDGLVMYLDIGVIDVETCKPLPNVLVDIWHANATGSYSGHPAPPGALDQKPPTEGWRKGLLPPFPSVETEEKWLRGAWPTDKNGVAQFTTIFPGYYLGRATHIHAKVYTKWTVLPPSPVATDPHYDQHSFFQTSRHVHAGQIFFSEDLNTALDNMYPYVNNPIRHAHGRTPNLQDSLNIFNNSFGPEGKYNPVFKTHLVGGVVNQGIISFITMGINVSASYESGSDLDDLGL